MVLPGGLRNVRRKKGKPMIWTNPDGSRCYVPEAEGAATAPRASAHIREFLREIGKRGGHERARRHAREELAGWGRVRHRRSNKRDISGRENTEATSHPRKRTVEECLRLTARDIKWLDGDARVNLGHGYTALVQRSAHDLIAVVLGPGLPQGGLETNVGLKHRTVNGWAKASGRPITAIELECAGCGRAVQNVYMAMDGCWRCQKCSGLTWKSRADNGQGSCGN
jgi:hypothetical protein